MEALRDIDLAKILEEYPNITRSNAKFRALLQDYYPQNRLETNLVVFFHGLGVLSRIKKKAFWGENDVKKLTGLMEQTYGTSYAYAYYAICQWANAYGIKCAPAAEDTAPIPIKNANIDSFPGSSLVAGDALFEDDNVKVTLKSIEGINFSGKFHVNYFFVNCIIQNKTQNNVYVSLFDVEMNGIVFDDVKAADVVHPNKTMLIKYLFNQNKLEGVGFSSIDELEIMSFEVAYSYKDHFFRLQDKERSKLVSFNVKEHLK